ncbi:MAG: tol-pal system-associated acyl-CoA thioesterase [Gammaproteobacteria bacterium]|nr:tol-pal system-associated acyl-CoA thioesterase [Gammaproteobacteria bacterium]
MILSKFIWQVRVYYEDTDAGGVVYYANYLAYMERARSEWLRTLGFDNQMLAQQQGVVFAVRRASVDYFLPARLDELLDVSLILKKRGRASLLFEQQVCRGDVLLCQGEILLACVDASSFKPTAIPQAVVTNMQ